MGFLSQLIASTASGLVAGCFVVVGVWVQFRHQSEAALRALRVEVGDNEQATTEMVQALAYAGPKGGFEDGKANPGWLRHSVWESQLPYVVQLVDKETLSALCAAYSTLEAVPQMRPRPDSPYARGGWIDVHITRMQAAFMTARQVLDRLQERLNSQSFKERVIEIIRANTK